MPIREDIEKSVRIKTDTIEEKMNNIIDTLDNVTYYVATINNLDIPLVLFDKTVQQKRPSEQIKITREKFNELKNQKYFYTETIKEEPDGKRIIGVEVILKPADVTHHHELERILKQSTITSPYVKVIEQLKSISTFEHLKMDRVPSIYQQDIFNYIIWLGNNDPRATQKHLVVEAVAGSGKTYTIEQATKLVPRNKTACFLAFNKHIVKEFIPRAPEFIKNNVMTLNSAGFKLVLYGLRTRGHGKKLSQTEGVDSNNVSLILDELFNKKYKHFSIEEIDAIKPPVNRLVSLLKGSGLEINYNNLNELIEKYNIEYENVELSDIQSLCKDVMEINKDIFNNTWNKIDFDDQIWLPLELDISAEKAGYQFDFVFIDETQDLNMAKIELAIKMCKPNGSIIAVGDRYQSIYGFTGADSEAIPKIIERLNAKVFPLSICYRCPKEHVRLAQQFVPHIEYATLQNSTKEAIEGSIEDIGLDRLIKEANDGDKVICRNSAPLVHPCFELIRHGKKATILGKDIGKQLENLMIKIKGKTLSDFLNRLERWKEKQVEKLESKKLSIDRVMDQYETLKVLSEDCDEIEEVLAKIKTIFSDNDKEGVVFSTIHKAKGLEVETKENSVYIIMSYNGKALMPSSWAKKPWELEQERNLQYVAYTRGKNKMYLVDKV